MKKNLFVYIIIFVFLAILMLSFLNHKESFVEGALIKGANPGGNPIGRPQVVVNQNPPNQNKPKPTSSTKAPTSSTKAPTSSTAAPKKI